MKHYLSVIFTLCLVFSKMVFANSTLDASSWLYEKVSKTNILDKSDLSSNDETEDNYKGISLVIAKQSLTITNKR